MRKPSGRGPGLHVGLLPLPQLRRLTIPGAPAYLHSLRILFISDVHLRPSVSDDRLRALIERIRSARAELILLGGDYAESERDCLRFFEALGSVHAPLGIYGVPGNNDPWPSLESSMARGGAQLLRNRCAALDLPGGRLLLGGCDEHKHGSPRTEALFPEEEGYRVLISHFPAPCACRADLMLSGHTHAGQFNLLGLTPYSLGFERRFRLLALEGLHRIDGMQLAVCGGIGVSRLPLRVGASPEMLLLEFAK